MTKPKASPAARPAEGGSYLRQKNGGLKRVAFTAPSDGPPPAADEAAAPPAAPAIDPAATQGPGDTPKEG